MHQSFTYDPDRGEDIVFRSQWLSIANARQLGDAWFLSAGSGAWAVVSSGEMEALRSVALPESLFVRLERAGVILTSANAATIAEDVRTWAEPHYRHPVHHIIVATLRCNLSCSYCHAAVVPANAGAAYDLDIATAEAILAFARLSKASVQSFEFQGGESLLNRPLIEHIVPRIREEYARLGKDVYISVQSNGTTLTDDMVSFLRAHGVSIGTSFDGTHALTDAHRRTNLGSPTAAKIAAAIERHNLPFLPTVTKTSLPEWRAVVDAQLDADQSVVTFQPVYPINSAARNWGDVGVDPADFRSIYSDVMQYLRSLWRDTAYPMERRMLLALRKLLRGRDVDYADFGNPCGMVHSQIVYDTKGNIYTCDEGRDFPEFKVGNVRTDAYETVVFGENTRRLKSLSIPNDAECQTCAYRPYCATCPVYTRAVDGKLHSRHAGTDQCLHTKLIFDTLLAWYAEDPDLILRAAASHRVTPRAR